MDNKVTTYKPLVWAKIEFGFDREVLYWEGNIKDFQEKLTWDYIIFPRHNDRRVPTSKVKDFAQVEPDDTSSFEFKISALTETQKGNVKEKVAGFKRNLARDPIDKEVDGIIKAVLNPDILKNKEEESKPLTKEQRFRTYLLIRKQKIAKIITGSYIWFKK